MILRKSEKVWGICVVIGIGFEPLWQFAGIETLATQKRSHNWCFDGSVWSFPLRVCCTTFWVDFIQLQKCKQNNFLSEHISDVVVFYLIFSIVYWINTYSGSHLFIYFFKLILFNGHCAFGWCAGLPTCSCIKSTKILLQVITASFTGRHNLLVPVDRFHNLLYGC